MGLIGCLGENESLSNSDIDDFLTFIRTVPYSGAIYESHVITRINIYGNQKAKGPMTITPDSNFVTR